MQSSAMPKSATQAVVKYADLKDDGSYGIGKYHASSKGFIYFTKYKRWGLRVTFKLHLSVKEETQGAAFDLISPQALALFDQFKVTILNHKFSSDRYIIGTQFTFYIYINHGVFSPSIPQLKQFISTTSKLFSEFGVIPDSDKAINAFFSMRDDQNFYGKYVHSRFIGRCYSPVNRENILSDLFETKPENFSPATHFKKLPRGTADQFIDSLILTLQACHNEFLRYHVTSDHVEKLIIRESRLIPSADLRHKYRGRELEMTHRLTQLIFLIDYFLNNQNFTQYKLIPPSVVKDDFINELFEVAEGERSAFWAEKEIKSDEKVIEHYVVNAFWDLIEQSVQMNVTNTTMVDNLDILEQLAIPNSKADFVGINLIPSEAMRRELATIIINQFKQEEGNPVAEALLKKVPDVYQDIVKEVKPDAPQLKI